MLHRLYLLLYFPFLDVILAVFLFIMFSYTLEKVVAYCNSQGGLGGNHKGEVHLYLDFKFVKRNGHCCFCEFLTEDLFSLVKEHGKFLNPSPGPTSRKQAESPYGWANWAMSKPTYCARVGRATNLSTSQIVDFNENLHYKIIMIWEQKLFSVNHASLR